MLSKAKDWLLNVMIVLLIGACSVGAGMGVASWWMGLRKVARGVGL